jgi:hydrogenase maturation factor
LTTLLFPTGVTPSEIRKVVNELKAFCQNWRITLCGGHTEITDAVVRPIVTGMMAGTVRKSNLIDKRNMKPGDAVLLTKSVAVEGTAIIAREFRQKLIELGISNAEIERCRNFLSNISIISEARIADQSKGISAMHDVTEGGLATALRELSDAGEHRIRVDMQKVPVYKETREICRALDINPLGLIGSGSLLICCRPQDKNHMMRAIRQAGIDVTTIGEIQARGIGIDALHNGETVAWPEFEVDEITKLYRLNGPC